MPSALIITQSKRDAETIREGLGSKYRVRIVAVDPAEPGVGERIKPRAVDVLFVDIRIVHRAAPAGGYHPWLEKWRRFDPAPEIIVLTPKNLVRQSVQCLKAGAGDYLTLPLFADEVRLVAATIDKALQRRLELSYLRRQAHREGMAGVLNTHNARMADIFAKIEAAAPTRTTVLLTGETGTGKGVLARVIHRASHHREGSFVGVHCGAIPDTLIESELFGHEKGAFTGALRKKMGKFEIARKGTIFLDEVGTLTPPAQVKLLQVLQERSFTRVGGEHEISADVRVIAAANTDLDTLSRENRFRRDLFYRLNVFPIELPPLRERPEDIPLFVRYFLERLNGESRKVIEGIAAEAMDALVSYTWPGNIRELENVIERAYILETAPQITLASLPADLATPFPGKTLLPRLADLPLAAARHQAVEDFEKQYLQELLIQNQGRINRSAAQAGISTRQLHKLLVRHKIRKENYKPAFRNSQR